jgi:monoamine oxidase
MALTRRALLWRVAKLGGLGAAYETLAALDFIRTPAAEAAALELPADAGRGQRVAILGAGLAGLTAAYELDRAGYDCVILEAADRPGGRVLTLRRGDSFRETHEPKPQRCTFDDGLYFDAGASRIPHTHTRVIDYCRRFGVALQPHVFASRAGLVRSRNLRGGRPQRLRRVLHDLQGHVVELLAKCSRTPGIDLPVQEDDVEALREMLRRMGGLGTARWVRPGRFAYTNREGRAGFARPPAGPGEPGVPLTPIGLDEILRSDVWHGALFADARLAMQASLLEPAGGMDRLFRAFLAQPARSGGTLADLVRTRARVTRIEAAEDGVRVAFRVPGGRGASGTIAADHCISTLPAKILRDIPSNLPRAHRAALEGLWPVSAGKVAWQAERFWETEDGIFGGISWTSDPIRQIIYPSNGFLSPKGILTGAYVHGFEADAFNSLPAAERLRQAREQGEKLHPGFAARVGHGLAISWTAMPHAGLGWIDSSHPDFDTQIRILARPQGRFHMAGDQLTHLSGWQEGAILSAWNAARAVAASGRL